MIRWFSRKRNFTRTALGLLLTLGACQSNLSPDQYVAWIQDYQHGLHVKREQDDFIFDVQFQPQDFFTLTGRPARPSVRQDVVMQYYLLKLSCKDPSQDPVKRNIDGAAQWQERLYYYSYLFQNDLFLEENGVKYPCVLFHFEQSDISNNRVFTLGFETPAQASGTSKLVIDSEQFGSLPVRIEIVKEKIPALKV
jgi:hypothetical protein